MVTTISTSLSRFLRASIDSSERSYLLSGVRSIFTGERFASIPTMTFITTTIATTRQRTAIDIEPYLNFFMPVLVLPVFVSPAVSLETVSLTVSFLLILSNLPFLVLSAPTLLLQNPYSKEVEEEGCAQEKDHAGKAEYSLSKFNVS